MTQTAFKKPVSCEEANVRKNALVKRLDGISRLIRETPNVPAGQRRRKALSDERNDIMQQIRDLKAWIRDFNLQSARAANADGLSALSAAVKIAVNNLCDAADAVGQRLAANKPAGEPRGAIKTKFVTVIVVTDPETKQPVEIEIRKMATGPMVGIDGSWLEQDVGDTHSPYDPGVLLDIPEDEAAS